MFFVKMKKEMKLRWTVIIAVIAIAGVALMASMSGGVPVEVYEVSKGTMEQFVEDTAQVKPLDNQTVYIDGSGKVVDIHVDVGDAVKKEDLLLSLEKTNLELQLRDAEAKIAAAKAQLSGTEVVNYANKIDTAKAAVEQARVARDSAQRSFEKAKELYEADAISKEDFKKAEDAYKTASAALNSANVQLEDVRQGAPDHLKSSYKAQLEQAVIYRDTILYNLGKQDVKADIDGVVLEKLIEVNTPAAPSTAAFVIGSAENLELEADILADDANSIQKGNKVKISGKPLEDKILEGEVIKIAPAAKEVTSALGVNQKRVPVTIKITSGTSLLKPGYSVDAKIITAERKDTIKVPDSAVFDYKGQSSVFVVEKGKAKLRPVKKGIESGSDIEIQEGLKAGDIVLVKPDNNIKEGSKIKLEEEKQ